MLWYILVASSAYILDELAPHARYTMVSYAAAPLQRVPVRATEVSRWRL
jgi:hypothetical protein